MRTFKAVIDLSGPPDPRRLFLLILAAAALPVLAETFSVQSYYPAPFAQYSGIMTTGTSKHTYLMRGSPSGNLGIGFSGAPLNKLVVQGETVVGGNSIPPGGEVLSAIGPGAGIVMENRYGSGSRWAMYSRNNTFYWWYSGSPTAPLYMNPDGRLPLCEPVRYTYVDHGTSKTYCPALRPYIYWSTDLAGNRLPIINGSSQGSAGYIMCCSARPW